jgi:hypothetical protein
MDWKAEESGFDLLQGEALFFYTAQAAYGTHPASYLTGKRPRGGFDHYHHLALIGLRIRGTMPLLHHTSSYTGA